MYNELPVMLCLINELIVAITENKLQPPNSEECNKWKELHIKGK